MYVCMYVCMCMYVYIMYVCMYVMYFRSQYLQSNPVPLVQ